jgi:SAGA-associated factor 29
MLTTGFWCHYTVSQQKRIKRKHDESMSADSPSSRNPKMQRSNSAAPLDGLQMHAEVAYRLPKQKNAEGEWIQCTITAILGGEGHKRK